MSGEEIRITIVKTPDKKGGFKKSFKIETSNFKGGACLTALENLREYMASIGVTITDTHQEMKPEMYESECSGIKNR